MVKRKMLRTSWLVILAGLFLIGSFSEAEAKRTLRDTPLTRLLVNGFSSQQAVDLLEDAGLSGLSRRQIYKNPMAGLTGLESFTDDQVELLQAATAVNLFLMRLDNYSWGPGDPGDTAYLAESVRMVQYCLNQARFEEVRNQLRPTLADFTEPLTIDHLIKATDNLTKTLTLLAQKSTISDPVAETEALVDSLAELALHYYVQENRGNSAIEEAIGYDILPDIASNQYPQVDLAGWVTVYNEDGTKAISETVPPPVAEPTTYPAAIFESVVVDGSDFVLTWSLPAEASGVPSGGYDIIIDGTDTGNQWRTAQTSIVISGLEEGVEHSFQIQTRWLQAEPDEVPISNTLSAMSASDVVEPEPELNPYAAAILETVQVDGSDFVLNWSLPDGTPSVPSGGYDIIIDGTDTGSQWRTEQTSIVISGLEEGVEHSFQIQARWLQAEPDLVPLSNVLSATSTQAGVEPEPEPEPILYPAAILETVEVDGSDFVLSWTLPTNMSEVPSGGYDIIIDGTDTGIQWRTEQTSVVISGLEERVEHSFQIQACWLQAEPDQVPLSNILSATNTPAVIEPEPEPSSYPAAILETVEVDGSDFVLNWALPNNISEIPSGGYDIIIDGVDTGGDWRTEQTSAVISGLEEGVEHSFRIQARWLQAEPDQVPLSNQLSSEIPVDSGGVIDPVEPPVVEPPVVNLPVVDPPADGILRVFPGAEGFGTDTKAGRGGEIIHVTNLNDSGAGSLREALKASNPRIVVFDVGGVIRLKSDISISSPYITVAGQTAPGDGIMIRDNGFRISTHDVLIKHIAIRLGDDGRSRDGSWNNADCLQILSGYNIVIDHVSASWGIDENMSVWGSNIHDLTFSHNLIAEGLQNSVHSEGRHSKGLLVGGNGNNPKNVAIIKNLFAHNHERNPQLKGGVTAVVANNLTYNSNNQYSWFVTSRDKVNETNKGTYVGNVGKDGPDALSATFIKISSSILPGSEIYEDDNMQLSRPSSTFKDGVGVMVNYAPIDFSPHTILPADDAMYYVLYEAGARPAYRDAVDDRIANPSTGEVVRGNGTVKDHSSGLWPSYANVYQPFYYGNNPNGDDDGDGYTNIEELLHQASAMVEGR